MWRPSWPSVGGRHSSHYIEWYKLQVRRLIKFEAWKVTCFRWCIRHDRPFTKRILLIRICEKHFNERENVETFGPYLRSFRRRLWSISRSISHRHRLSSRDRNRTYIRGIGTGKLIDTHTTAFVCKNKIRRKKRQIINVGTSAGDALVRRTMLQKFSEI